MSTMSIVLKSSDVSRETRSEVLAELVNHEARNIRNAVGRNKATPVSALRVLAADSSDSDRAHVHIARRSDLPADIYSTLATSSTDQARLEVAKNTNTPAAVLEGLRMDADKGVSMWADANLTMSRNAYAKLVKDCNEIQSEKRGMWLDGFFRNFAERNGLAA
ncbi:hypothetical protein [Citricoccus nitrophenolicus]|uniref:hypothetical protein n=1 Tax=Citricoccus nitrophenolicus TaxID=863575 RepID=UPI0031F11BC5